MLNGFTHFKFGSEEEQEAIYNTIINNKQWIVNTHNYLMRNVKANSWRIEKQGSREVRVPCIIMVKSAYNMSHSKAPSLLTRTLDHFDKKQLLSFEREDKILEIVKEIIK